MQLARALLACFNVLAGSTAVALVACGGGQDTGETHDPQTDDSIHSPDCGGFVRDSGSDTSVPLDAPQPVECSNVTRVGEACASEGAFCQGCAATDADVYICGIVCKDGRWAPNIRENPPACPAQLDRAAICGPACSHEWLQCFYEDGGVGVLCMAADGGASQLTWLCKP